MLKKILFFSLLFSLPIKCMSLGIIGKNILLSELRWFTYQSICKNLKSAKIDFRAVEVPSFVDESYIIHENIKAKINNFVIGYLINNANNTTFVEPILDSRKIDDYVKDGLRTLIKINNLGIDISERGVGVKYTESLESYIQGQFKSWRLPLDKYKKHLDEYNRIIDRKFLEEYEENLDPNIKNQAKKRLFNTVIRHLVIKHYNIIVD